MIFFVIQSILLCQSIDPKFQKKILEQFGLRNYKYCVDEGVKYLIENGREELKRNILFAKRNLESYDSTKLSETDSLIENCIIQLPNIIPNYAIYAGLAEVTYWMMYKDGIAMEDWEKIINFSSNYFKKAIDSTPKDSNLVLSQIYLNAFEIFLHYGVADYSELIIRKAYELNPNGYRVSLELSRIMEQEGEVDSSEIILSNTFNNYKYKSSYENVYEFIGDNLEKNQNKILYYNKAIDFGVKKKSKIYKKMGDLYFGSESIPYYEQALKYDPKNEDLLIDLGFQYNLKYDYEKSLLYYSKVKNWKAKSNFKAKFHCKIIGKMYYYKEDYKKALEYFKISNEHYSLALCYARLNDHKKAIDQYNEEIKNYEESFWGGEEDKKKYLAEIYYNIGLSYVELKKYQQAFDSFEYSNSIYEMEGTKYLREVYRIASKNPGWDVVNDSNTSIHLIDKKRVSKNGSRIKAWIKSVLCAFDKDISVIRLDYINSVGLEFDKYKNYNSSLIYIEFDCNKSQSRLLQKIDYDERGNTISSFNFNDNEFSVIIPESIGEGWMQYLCEGKYKN